jgi:hypothetical protein
MPIEDTSLDQAAIDEAIEAQRRKVTDLPLDDLIAETETLYERAHRAYHTFRVTRRFQEWLDHQPSQLDEELLHVTATELSARCYGECAELMELVRIGLASGDAAVLEEAGERFRTMPPVMQRCMWAHWFPEEPEYEGAIDPNIVEAEELLDVAIRLRHDAQEKSA